MEYRANFILWLLVEIAFVAVQVGMVSVYFNFTDNIAGWTKPQVFLLIGIFRVIEGIFHMFFFQNLLNFPENISTGNMDLFFTRPVNSLFLSSSRYHSLDEFGTFLVGIALVWYSLIQLQFSFSLLLLFELFVLFFFGLLTLYSIILIFSSLSFFFTRMTALHSVYDVITKALRIPINIITKDSFIGNSLLFPLLIVATLPSQILLGYVTPIFITLEIIGSLAIFMVAHKFFYFALRHYSSASS